MRDEEAGALTEEVLASLAGARSARLRTITESLVRHLHAFVRETSADPSDGTTRSRS